jgi:hypothetical protein
VTHSKLRSRAAFFGLLGAIALVFAATPVFAGSGGVGKSSERSLTEAVEGNFEVLEAADQYAEARTAPADTVDAGAFSGAYLAAKSLPLVGGAWSEITTKPYDSDAHGYRDPVWSNSGGGSGIVGGRTTALAVDGNTLYAGAADGGVWKRAGGKWTPLTDDAPTLSTGALAVDSSHGLWVGTGEINTSSDSYSGIGVLYKSAKSSTFTRVGGDELNNHTIGTIVFDNGFVLVATNRGLYRHSATPNSDPWTPVLKQGVGLPTTCTAATGAPGVAFISDVAVRPGTNGNTVLAVVGWRAGSNCNGFYLSNNGGQTFSLVNITGALNEGDLARTSIAYSADGSHLYALVQSASMFNQAKTDFGGTLLQGIYSAPSGDVTAAWTKVAEWRNLQNSGSALTGPSYLGYHPGVQAWYNQFIAVDPANANHIFLGLEEVFESYDGGATWKAVGPYWNFGLPCSTGPQGLDGCPPTTHPDQHAVVVGSNTVYVGNDGGVYTRGVNATTPFASANNGYNTLQYYYAEAGPVAGGDAIWGGLQDNGVSLLLPGASTMVSPFGGDGTDNIVDHTNGNRAVNAYVDLDMALTTNGGQSDGVTPAYREITPSCFAFTYTPSPCDPLPRFVAPFEADSTSPSHWVAGGRYLWDNQSKGWNTTCGASACDWKITGDSGSGHSITQIAIANGTWYAAWCGPCNSAGFARGILTNVGGTSHQLTLPSTFPNRFIQGLYVEPGHPLHAYVVFSGFSRRWTSTFSAGEGHVYETTDGGTTWTDISGTGATALPDAPGDDIILTASGKLVVASDIGVFVASAGQGAATTWSRFGVLPNASVNDLTLSPDGSYLIAATHGRGLWKIATP